MRWMRASLLVLLLAAHGGVARQQQASSELDWALAPETPPAPPKVAAVVVSAPAILHPPPLLLSAPPPLLLSARPLTLGVAAVTAPPPASSALSVAEVDASARVGALSTTAPATVVAEPSAALPLLAAPAAVAPVALPRVLVLAPAATAAVLAATPVPLLPAASSPTPAPLLPRTLPRTLPPAPLLSAASSSPALASGPASDVAFQEDADALADAEQQANVEVGANTTAGAQNKRAGAALDKAPKTAAQLRAHKAKKRGKTRAVRRKTRLQTASLPQGEALLQETSGMCHFIERDPFEELFQSLNTTRWDESSLDGLFHCHKGEDSTCTMATSANLALNASLPFYPNGNATGAVLLLSQDPCNDPYHKNLCCGVGKAGLLCSNWTGAHVVSRGCILYGTLEAEMSVRMPKGSNPFWDVGTYVYGGKPDPTWNELDMIFTTRAANDSNAASMFDTFTTTIFSASFFDPIEHKEDFGPTSYPDFSGYTANQYHNYSMTWAPSWISWSIDSMVYWNQTRRGDCFTRRCAHHVGSLLRQTLIPWRPQTIRLILRTADGSSYPQPNVHVYLRRLSYVPLPPSQVLADTEKSAVQLAERALVGLLASLLILVALRWLHALYRGRGGTELPALTLRVEEDWVASSLNEAAREWAAHNWEDPSQSYIYSKGDARQDARKLSAAVAALAEQGVEGAERLPLLAKGRRGAQEQAQPPGPRQRFYGGGGGAQQGDGAARGWQVAPRSDPEDKEEEEEEESDAPAPAPRPPPRAAQAQPAAHMLPARTDAQPRKPLRGLGWGSQTEERPGASSAAAPGGALGGMLARLAAKRQRGARPRSPEAQL